MRHLLVPCLKSLIILFNKHVEYGVQVLPSKSSCACSAESQTLTVGVFSKVRVYCRCQARRKGSSCSKDPNSPMASRQGFLKTGLGKRVGGCMISSWSFFWLVGGEVTGWCFRNLSLLVPTSLVSVCLWSACSVTILHLHRGLSFCRRTPRYAPGC